MSKLYQKTMEKTKGLYDSFHVSELPPPAPGVALTIDQLVYKEYHTNRLNKEASMSDLQRLRDACVHILSCGEYGYDYNHDYSYFKILAVDLDMLEKVVRSIPVEEGE